MFRECQYRIAIGLRNLGKKQRNYFVALMNASQEAIRITPKMNLVDGLKKRGVTPLKSKCICPTITSIPDDFIHYKEPRIMTVRECARIQSFTDDYIFLGNYTTGGSRRKQRYQDIRRLQMLFHHFSQNRLELY